MVRSGNDIFTILKDNFERINHIHIKDVDEKGRWVLLGDGITNVKGVLQFLQENEYKGWIIAEDESELSKSNQFEAVKHNLNYLKKIVQNL